MNVFCFLGQSTSSLNGSYTDGYLDCLNGALMFLWQTGVITNPQTCDVVRDTLLQQLLQKTGQNSTTVLSHGVATPSIVHVQPVPFVNNHGTSGVSELPSIAFGTPDISQMPHVSDLGIFDVSQTPTIPFDKRAQIPDIYGLGTSGLSKVPFQNEVPMPCAGSQFSAASFNLSQSLPKSRFVPYKTNARPALRNKNANSAGPREELSTRTETIKSDTAPWSLNDDICYSIAPFSWKSSDKSDQPLAKESSSNSHAIKKLQEKTSSESMAMSRNSATETRRPLSTKVSSNVQLPGSSGVNATSKSTILELKCIDETQRLMVAESSAAVKEHGSHTTTSDRETSSGKKHPPMTDNSTGASSEESNQDDLWRPF